MNHGFSGYGNNENQINFILLRNDQNEIEFTISDNGKGIPEGIEYEQISTIGLRTVYDIVEKQLFGKIMLDRKNGTSFKIIVNENKDPGLMDSVDEE